MKDKDEIEKLEIPEAPPIKEMQEIYPMMKIDISSQLSKKHKGSCSFTFLLLTVVLVIIVLLFKIFL